MFDAPRGDVGDDANDDQWDERHDRDRRTDLRHQHNGDSDDGKTDHDVVDQNDEERNSFTSFLKRLTASPAESGNCDAPGRLRMCVKRFLRSSVPISAKMGTSA
jgi:hypothetical protein